jgi:hypothetical protein
MPEENEEIRAVFVSAAELNLAKWLNMRVRGPQLELLHLAPTGETSDGQPILEYYILSSRPATVQERVMWASLLHIHETAVINTVLSEGVGSREQGSST